MKKVLVLGFVFLLLLSAGILIYYNRNNISFLNQLPDPDKKSQTAGPDEVLALFKAFESSPSAQSKTNLLEEVNRLAQEGDSIILKDCQPSPEILKTKSSSINLTYHGSGNITLLGLPSLKEPLKPNQSVTVTLEPGVYPYNCADKRGIIYVPQQPLLTSDDLTKSDAKEVSVIEVSSCKPTPLIAQFNSGQKVTFKNSGKEKERIYLSGMWDFNLKPSEKSDLVKALEPGIYRYSCESKSTGFVNSGAIYIP